MARYPRAGTLPHRFADGARRLREGPLAGLEAAARQVIPVAIGLFAIPFTVYALIIVLHKEAFGIDFHYAFWPAAVRVVHGLTPYVDPGSPTIAGGSAFVYPAPTALLIAPFGYLGRDLGNAIFTSLTVLAIPATLWALNVRDWRVYTVVFVWSPIFHAWETANITTLLGFGVALAWRWRERPGRCGPMLALVISMKLFLWPLGVWLLATRRYAAVGYAFAAGVALNVVSWLALGTDELPRYVRLVRALTDAEERRAYSVISYGLNHGVGRPLAYAVGLTLAVAVMAACVVVGRRGRDADALMLGLVASILASPLVWLHYFSLLLVPVAIARPRLSPLWGLPVVLWLCSPTRPGDAQLLVALVVAAALVAGVWRALADPGPVADRTRISVT